MSGLEAWREDAACSGIDPELWTPATYSTHDDRTDAHKAARVCFGSCPVRVECLNAALRDRERDGIWGGLNPAQRTRWAKARDDEGRQAVVDGARMTCGLSAERVS